MVDLDELRALIERGDVRDRAFVDANLRLAWARADDPNARSRIEAVHDALGEASRRAHREVRARIRTGELRGDALRRRFDAVAPEERDHHVEEVLGVAYPPFDEPPLGRELIAYTPSGYDEIVHAFEATRLRAGDRLLDIGAGTGKVVVLASLLTGAAAIGVECNAALVAIADGAADALDVAVHFRHGDARDVDLDDVDVVFAYLPFVGEALARVIGRLAERRRARFLCCAVLDDAKYGTMLVEAGAPKSWMHVYAWR